MLKEVIVINKWIFALYLIITFVVSLYLTSTDREWMLFWVVPLIIFVLIIIAAIDSLKYNRLLEHIPNQYSTLSIKLAQSI